MKVLQVISSFPPAYTYGGPAGVAYAISKALVKRGHEVTVYTTDVCDSNSRLKYDKNPAWMDGIEVHRFKNVNNKLAHRNLAIAPTMAFALRKNVNPFAIIHLHEYRSFQAILVHHYAKEYNVPYILQAHGSVLPIFEKQGSKKLYDLVWGNRILKDASNLFAVTKTEAEQYKKMGVDEKKIEIVPNGIDLSEFDNLPQRGEFRKKWGIDDSQKVILYLARIHKIKGPDLLAKAFAEFSKEVDNVKLVIAGPDEGYLPSLKKLIADLEMGDKVLFTGPLYREERLGAYVDADVYVLPSIHEIFGISILEACGCGTPVVVTDRCGIADVVDGQAGLAVPYDKDQLRDAIIRILNDKELQRKFGEEGKRLVREEFGWDEVVRMVEKVYED